MRFAELFVPLLRPMLHKASAEERITYNIFRTFEKCIKKSPQSDDIWIDQNHKYRGRRT